MPIASYKNNLRIVKCTLVKISSRKEPKSKFSTRFFAHHACKATRAFLVG